MESWERSDEEIEKRRQIIDWHKRHFKDVLSVTYEALLNLVDIGITLNKIEDNGWIYHPNHSFVEAKMRIFDIVFENLTKEGQDFLKNEVKKLNGETYD